MVGKALKIMKILYRSGCHQWELQIRQYLATLSYGDCANNCAPLHLLRSLTQLSNYVGLVVSSLQKTGNKPPKLGKHGKNFRAL